MASTVEIDDLVESDDYYAWLGLNRDVSCLCSDCCFIVTFVCDIVLVHLLQ